MKRGPKPQPVGLRALHGNPSIRPLPVDVPEGKGELWASPPWFDEEQRAQWDFALEWAPVGLLTATDRNALVIWCCASVEHAKAVQAVRRDGQLVETKNGHTIPNPSFGVMNRQALIMARMIGELGFSPAARTALGRSRDLSSASIEPLLPGHRSDALDVYLDEKPDRLDS